MQGYTQVTKISLQHYSLDDLGVGEGDGSTLVHLRMLRV